MDTSGWALALADTCLSTCLRPNVRFCLSAVSGYSVKLRLYFGRTTHAGMPKLGWIWSWQIGILIRLYENIHYFVHQGIKGCESVTQLISAASLNGRPILRILCWRLQRNCHGDGHVLPLRPFKTLMTRGWQEAESFIDANPKNDCTIPRGLKTRCIARSAEMDRCIDQWHSFANRFEALPRLKPNDKKVTWLQRIAEIQIHVFGKEY